MILILDAHALLWWLGGEPSFDRAARASVADPANTVIVSAATIWELEIKRAIGKLQAPDNLIELLDAEQFDCIPILGDDAMRAARLPMHHSDPFDRMVLAQAMRLDAIVVSRDHAFDAYGVPVLRA